MAETKESSEKKAVKPKKASTTKAAAKPKAAPKKEAAAKKVAAKPAAKKTKAGSTSPEHRYRMIEVAAYYLAEKDNFAGSPVEYWIAAELQFNQ
jgi:hypothetical protein